MPTPPAYGKNPNAYGVAVGRFINLEDFDSADIENNYLEGTAGIYMLNYSGDHTAGESSRSPATKQNIDGRKSDGAGGYLDFNTPHE